MKIVQATLEHLDELGPLFEAYRIFYKKPANELKTRQFLTERILKRESIIFLIYTDGTSRDNREGGDAVGFTQLYPTFSSIRLGRLWLLNDIFVVPEARGEGFSIALIDHVKEMARKTGAVGVVLQTDITNDVGNKLYPRMGFELDSASCNYYGWYNPEFVL
jgi:GNAT superfamily N-acetyltransferase